MKKCILILAFASLSLYCSSDYNRRSESAQFIGKWKMTASLIDPGDGSGVYEPVSGNKTLEFLENGVIRTNYPMCSLNPATEETYTSPYNADDDYIQVQNCGSEPDYKVNYDIENGNLILSYPCIEACLVKFERVTSE